MLEPLLMRVSRRRFTEVWWPKIRHGRRLKVATKPSGLRFCGQAFVATGLVLNAEFYARADRAAHGALDLARKEQRLQSLRGTPRGGFDSVQAHAETPRPRDGSFYGWRALRNTDNREPITPLLSRSPDLTPLES